jgi:predicted metal-dependent hydrolase
MLPSYTVRESRRAKHVSLKISSTGDLEVVIPPGFDRQRIPAIVQRKQNWIERVTRRIESQQAIANLDRKAPLPQQITLRSINADWQVEYCASNLTGVRLVEQKACQVVLYGNIANHELCQSSLQQWIAHRARIHLVPWLSKVSKELKLPFKRATIRRQKTIWGSCSGQKSISLNSKLLFLPDDLVRYVFIHELCHTIHLNHSSDFWTLVGKHEPNYQRLDDSLRDARYWVPVWMD